jgi:predicted nucleic acid-binding protein
MALLICATAVHHGLIVLHVDNDFAAIAGVLPEVRQRDIRA